MEIVFDILEIAVIVVYIAMVVHILWANAKLLKSDSEIRSKYGELLKDKYILQLAHDRLRLAYDRKIKECERLQPSSFDIAQSIEREDRLRTYNELKRDYDAVCRTNKEVFQENDELKERHEKLLEEYDKLKRDYSLLSAYCASLMYVNEQIKEIAEEECPNIASFYKKMMFIREQSLKEVKEKIEHAKQNNEDNFGVAFESAAQESSKEEWDKSVEKEKAEED